MPLTLVLGPANAAKAGEVLGAYALAARRDALLVVPTAADVVHFERELASPGVTLGRALTFSGLLEEIAARTRYRRLRLTPLQRERTLRHAVASLRLRALGGPAAGAGFARSAGRLIAELEQARIDPASFGSALNRWAAGAPDRVAYTRELAAIYRRYLDLLAAHDREDAERFAWGALDALRERPEIWGSTPIFLYGFDDLTPIELDTVETLSQYVDAAVTVSLTYEPGRPALAARAGVVEELRGLAQSVTQLPALDEYYAVDSRAALHHLERHLFEPDPPVLDPHDAVALMEAGSQGTEAELVASDVRRALAEGVAPLDIVIICRSLARSGELFEQTLARHGVAAASTRRVPLGHTAMGRALLGLARYALWPGSQRQVGDLLAYLRHPGVADSPEAVDLFEREVRQRGGRVEAALRICGPALDIAMASLQQVRLASDRLAAISESTRWLLAAPHRGTAPVSDAGAQQDAHAAAVVFAAIEQLQALGPLGGEPAPAAELIEVLEGLEVPAHGAPPAGAVLVSEPLAIRARRFRRVFVTGLCEGEFPSPQAALSDPFLSDDRRRELALSTGLVLPQSVEALDRERYLLYACASRATERVVFSYRTSDEDGNVVIASPFLDDVASLFPETWRARRRRRLLADVVWSEAEAPTERERVLAQVFSPTLAGGRLAVVNAPATRVLSASALAHVRHRQIVSAGALEAFAACPLRWLVERQLRPEQLEPDPDPLTRGSFIHTVLERVFARLGGALTPGTLAQAEQLLHEEMRGPEAASDRSRLALDQAAEVRAAILRGIEAELLRYLREEAADGCDWAPIVSELRFGLDAESAPAMSAVALEDGNDQVWLSGIIDRVDADPRDPSRVIVRDYKSGAKRDTWPAARWVGDRQIQVALYMIAVQRLLQVRAVAGFYQPLAGEDLRARGVYADGVPVGTNTVVRDSLSDPDLTQLLREIEDAAVALAATLRRGELTPCPERCSPDGTCRYPGICWGAG